MPSTAIRCRIYLQTHHAPRAQGSNRMAPDSPLHAGAPCSTRGRGPSLAEETKRPGQTAPGESLSLNLENRQVVQAGSAGQVCLPLSPCDEPRAPALPAVNGSNATRSLLL